MIKVLELFGGIGAPRQALQKLGIDFEVVDYVEIDKYAVKSYNAIYNENFEPQDIMKWDKDLEVDLIFHGSPCQDFSIAGKGKGGDEGSGTRSSLLYETIRIVEKIKPKYVIWENVKAVLNKNHKHNFDNYLEKMKELGYTNYYQILNAKDYGIPQNRERVFTVSILGNSEFDFPPKQELKLRLKDMLEYEVDEKYYLEDIKPFVAKKYKEFGNIPNMFNPYNKSEIKDIAPTQSTQCGSTTSSSTVLIKNATKKGYIEATDGDGIDLAYPEELIQSQEGICRTIPAGTHASTPHLLKTQVNDYRIRKLTPLECWRLMGFSDGSFYKAQEVNSNCQLYKQAGNSIVVNVLMAIFGELFDINWQENRKGN